MKTGTDKRSVIIREAVSVVLAVTALILSLLSSAKGAADGAEYGVTRMGAVTVMCVLAAVFSAAAGAIGCVGKGTWLSAAADVLRFASAALLMACFSIMISERGDLMGYIWFSDLEAGNADATAALYLALASWIIYFAAVIWEAVSIAKDYCVFSRRARGEAGESPADA